MNAHELPPPTAAFLLESSQVGMEELDSRETTFRVVTLDELLQRADPEYLVEKLLKPGDLMIAYGPAGCGKTFAVMDLIAQLVKGEGQFAGQFKINRKARVVYCTGEGRGSIGKRLRAALERHHAMPFRDRLGIVEDVPHFIEWGTTSGRGLEDWLNDVRVWEPDLIVFDTLVYGMAGGDENSTEDSAQALSHLSRVQKELPNAVIILVHHANKSGEFRGSTAWLGGGDVIAKFKKNPTETGAGTFESEKTKDSPAFEPIAFRLSPESETCVVEWEGKVVRTKTKAAQLTEDLVAFLREHCPGESAGLTVAAIKERGDFTDTPSKITEALRPLAANPRSVIRGAKRAVEGERKGGPRSAWHFWADPAGE